MKWSGIIRLGLVQAALGSVVVLVTSTLNRVMVVEYALPAVLPGMLVALHYAVQLIRPRFGYGSDRGGRCVPWIVGGMAVLATGGVLCAVATVALSRHPALGLMLAIGAYLLVGLGVGAAGTSLLVLVAKRVDDRNRAAAATVIWVLMIAGFAVTSSVVGRFLDPFSPQRLVEVTSVSVTIAFVVALLAVWGVEPAGIRRAGAAAAPGAAVPHELEPPHRRSASFAVSLRRIWSEPAARRFTVFVFVSMLAYSAEELLLEPYAGLILGFSLGQSAKLSGQWHGSVLVGMLLVAVLCSGKRRPVSLRVSTVAGCCASGLAVLSLLGAEIVGPQWPLHASVIALGVSNGVFAVSAIGSMMQLAHRGEAGNAGVRMGLWGAAQAVGFAVGGLFATSMLDAIRLVFGSPSASFKGVFCAEAALFLAAAWFAAQVDATSERGGLTNSTAVTV